MAVYNRTFSTILSGNLKPIVNTKALYNNDTTTKKTTIRFELKSVEETIKDPDITIETRKKSVCDYITNIIGNNKTVFHVGMFQSYLVDNIAKESNNIDVLIDYDYTNIAVLDYLSNKKEVRLYIGNTLYNLDNISVFYNSKYDYVIIDDYKGDDFILVKVLQWCKNVSKKVISINNKRILGYFNKTIIKEDIIEGYTITTLRLK